MKGLLTRSGIVCIFVLCIGSIISGCGGNSNGGGTVIAEPVPNPGSGDDDDDDNAVNPLFSLEPGTWVPRASYGGIVDPVGTNLNDDFDGDGILNINETTSNVWIADYPFIETYIAPPISMKIEILTTSGSVIDTIDNEIDKSDMESKSNTSSEAAHREEVNLRTVQFQDKRNEMSHESNLTSSGRQKNTAVNGHITIKGVSGGGSYGYGKGRKDTLSTAIKEEYGEVKTKWATTPFKNNLQKNAYQLKRNEAAKNARQTRLEIHQKVDETSIIKSDAGYVRAAFYITNESINMPVKMSNILCSFMFEATDGTLIPVQSFRLRNDDYSLFEIELYGGTTFGPYVIELKNLNTMQIREAIALGYNPRMFIVDYKMTHVEDSNYRQSLSDSFSGDNLKIIEENAKGRSVGVKIVGPGIRGFYRVAAFDSDGEESRWGTTGENISPGVSLEKALSRISMSDCSIEYAYYMLDFTDLEPPIDIKKCVVRGIKSINGIATHIPHYENNEIEGTLTGFTNETIRVYTMKPVADWTDEDYENFKMWVVYADGRYYMHGADMEDIQQDTDGNITARMDRTFEYNSESYLVLDGINSTVWAGDHYDIVYLDFQKNEEEVIDFGNNPIDTGKSLTFNTRWSMDWYDQNHYFYPETHSRYIGTAGLGDTVEFTIRLTKNRFLDPNFGTPEDYGTSLRVYRDFSYGGIDDSYTFLNDFNGKFNYDEAVDFELSLSIGGDHKHWVNLKPERNIEYYNSETCPVTYDEDPEKIQVVKESWDFLNQEFHVRLTLPDAFEGVGREGIVNLYLRPALNNAYRESMWPMPYDRVKSFKGKIAVPVNSGNNISINDCIGEPVQGSSVILTNGSESVTATITTVTSTTGGYDLVLDVTDLSLHFTSGLVRGDVVYSDGPLAEKELEIAHSYSFFDSWNSLCGTSDLWSVYENSLVPLSNTDWILPYVPANQLGFVTGNTDSVIESNWTGGYNYGNPFWNNWADAGWHTNDLEQINSPYLSAGDSHLWFVSESTDDSLNSMITNTIALRESDTIVSGPDSTSKNNAKVYAAGDRAFVVWEEDNTIVGRIYDISQGNLIGGNQLSISVQNYTYRKNPVVSISGDKAVVAWAVSDDGNDWNIRGRVIDIAAGFFLPTGNDFLINSELYESNDQVLVCTSGDRALVVWSGPDDGNEIKGRVLDISTVDMSGVFVTDEFIISLSTSGNQRNPSLCISGDRALVTWIDTYNGTYYIRGGVVELSTGNVIGNNGSTTNMLISNDVICNRSELKVSASNGRGLVVWKTDENGSTDIKGRIVDMEQVIPLNSQIDLHAHHTGCYRKEPAVTVFNDRALVVYAHYDDDDDIDNQLEGTIVNMQSGTIIGNGGFDIQSSDDSGCFPQCAVYNNNCALVIWQHVSGQGIGGAVIDVTTGQTVGGSGNLFAINASQDGSQIDPQMYLSDNQVAMVVWKSTYNDQDSIMGQSTIISYEGLGCSFGQKHFFTAPLIERNYEVTARYVDDKLTISE